jgi:hypothetical protein
MAGQLCGSAFTDGIRNENHEPRKGVDKIKGGRCKARLFHHFYRTSSVLCDLIECRLFERETETEELHQPSMRCRPHFSKMSSSKNISPLANQIDIHDFKLISYIKYLSEEGNK